MKFFPYKKLLVTGQATAGNIIEYCVETRFYRWFGELECVRGEYVYRDRDEAIIERYLDTKLPNYYRCYRSDGSALSTTEDLDLVRVLRDFIIRYNRNNQIENDRLVALTKIKAFQKNKKKSS